jgi:MYXO-CTERM domain-containing protein
MSEEVIHMKRQLGLSAVLLLSACQLDPNITQEQDAIINGENAIIGQFPAVGALVQPFGGSFFQFCTGTLIAPNLVLSAAHCIDPELNGQSLAQIAASTRVVFNQINVNNGPQAGGIVASVDRIIENGAFDLTNLQAGNDVSILVLKESVVGIEPIPFSVTPATDLIGQRFTSVGFGVSNAANQSGGGIQRFTDFELEAVEGEIMRYGFNDNGQGDDTTGVCSGDSGGPDLIEINGVTQVFGIHSFVDSPNGLTCLDGVGTQRTDTQANFIQAQIDLFGEKPPVVEPVPVDGCSVTPTSKGASSSAVFLLFAFGVFVWRRRSTH